MLLYIQGESLPLLDAKDKRTVNCAYATSKGNYFPLLFIRDEQHLKKLRTYSCTDNPFIVSIQIIHVYYKTMIVSRNCQELWRGLSLRTLLSVTISKIYCRSLLKPMPSKLFCFCNSGVILRKWLCVKFLHGKLLDLVSECVTNCRRALISVAGGEKR